MFGLSIFQETWRKPRNALRLVVIHLLIYHCSPIMRECMHAYSVLPDSPIKAPVINKSNGTSAAINTQGTFASHAILCTTHLTVFSWPLPAPIIRYSLSARRKGLETWLQMPIPLDEKPCCDCELYNFQLLKRKCRRNPSLVFYPLKQTWLTKHLAAEKGRL